MIARLFLTAVYLLLLNWFPTFKCIKSKFGSKCRSGIQMQPLCEKSMIVAEKGSR